MRRILASVAWALTLASSGGCVVQYTVAAEGDTGTDTDDDTCPAATVRCGEACVDAQADPDHCGGCGQACGAGQVCDAGECSDECSDGRSECSGGCVDLSSDPLHCGECGESCQADGTCVAGDCKDACNDSCEDGVEVCVSGTCECRSGFSRCEGACVNVLNDPEHCGQCDRECEGEDTACGGGECVAASCEGFDAQCGGSCVDLSSDPLHCRECGRPCKGDETCVDGDCED